MTHAHFRLDWLREANKLNPYFDGQPGVVRIDFESEDAAVDKFNHFIKEQFQRGNANCHWLSLRLDDEWSTTFTVDDQIFAVARKLEESGVQVDWKQAQSSVGDVASGNHAGGDIDINISDSVIVNGMDASPKGVEYRLGLVCDAMKKFVENGGHFMLIINDMKRHDQGRIWKTIWNAGLRDAGGDNLSLIYYVGRQCGQVPHDDAPAPNVAFRLPHDIETDEARQDEVYNDIIEILTTREGYNADEASKAAGSIVGSNSYSVRRLHMSLSSTIMFNAAKKGCV
ncbi:hypothetical protein VQ045_19505 [Aurantimonas sp. E1-2-R+4]|uniref:hypothetical protein n=1 Tax=Aurantimonas sp. E1-2-R+4 TaxID=3113714 RepID=UPI002F93E2B8